jgi:hypothetical protein
MICRRAKSEKLILPGIADSVSMLIESVLYCTSETSYSFGGVGSAQVSDVAN